MTLKIFIMGKAEVRDYGELVRRIEALASEEVRVEVLAEAAGYPIFGVESGIGDRVPTGLVMGGIHGDEPA